MLYSGGQGKNFLITEAKRSISENQRHLPTEPKIFQSWNSKQFNIWWLLSRVHSQENWSPNFWQVWLWHCTAPCGPIYITALYGHGHSKQWSRYKLTIRVGYSKGPLFRKSIPTNPKSNPKADPNPITLTLTLIQTLALWRVSAQWTFGIVELWNSKPVPN